MIEKKELQDLINQNAKFKNVYFWTPPATASGRRSYEQYNSRYLLGTYNGHDIDCSLDISCSCKNVYVSRKFKIDGRQVTIAAVKKLINS